MLSTMKTCNIIYSSHGDLGVNQFTAGGTIQSKGDLSLIKFTYEGDDSVADYSFSILKNNVIRLTKKGDVNYTLTFDESAPYSTFAETMGFKLPITLTTNKINVDLTDNSLSLFLDYKLDIGGNISLEKVNLKVNF